MFVFLWFSSFFLHEVCHGVEVYRQCGGRVWVEVDFQRLSMLVSWGKDIYSPRLVWLAGGVYCSLVLFLLAVLNTGFFCWVFLTLGWVQLCYGLYEWRYKIKYRYVIYVVVVLVMVVFWFAVR